jgi:hypothetical protein
LEPKVAKHSNCVEQTAKPMDLYFFLELQMAKRMDWHLELQMLKPMDSHRGLQTVKQMGWHLVLQKVKQMDCCLLGVANGEDDGLMALGDCDKK